MNPLPFNKKTTTVKYCDYKSREELIKEYPDLKNFNIVKTSYVCGADDLNCIEDNSQDFVIASHVFEHLTNPIKALQEFYRVTKNN
jgi:ubiquinone/menaquinone biosynthesis C-methylase UbiE